MIPRSVGAGALAVVLTLGLGACAPDAADVPQGGSRLEPSFHPAKKQRPAHRAPQGHQQGGRGKVRNASPSASPDDGAGPTGGGTSSASPGAGASSTAGAEPASADVADRSNDVSGLGSPSYVDLAGATLTRDGDRYRLVVEVASALPDQQADDSHIMNVVGFVDTDLDGSVDHEVWATLADNGWGTSARHPDGARFGDESGVTVTVSGSTMTLAFAASVIGGPDAFQWSVASEYGTYEQVASGTTAQDYAPDGGAVPYPG